MGFTFMQFDKSSIFKLRLLDIEPVFKDKISKCIEGYLEDLFDYF
jgi:hypothetical protein